ncbi:MAG: GPP34 family phosphoprotein [Catenulispora sp.]|nr:GPP34 family phosphoprotein [Catenulispora sp.]NUT40015.1 GPP34 family phosphoprotein [Thermoactinospora sp.]
MALTNPNVLVRMPVADDLWLITYDQWAPKHTVSDPVLSYGVAAALVAELVLGRCAVVNHAGHTPGLTVKGAEFEPLDPVLKDLLHLITNDGWRPVKEWIRYAARNAVHDVAGRLCVRELLLPVEVGTLRKRIAWQAASPKASTAIDYRPGRVAAMLGADQHRAFAVHGIEDVALVALCDALGLRHRLLVDGVRESHTYIDQVQLRLAHERPDVFVVVQALGEMAGTSR